MDYIIIIMSTDFGVDIAQAVFLLERGKTERQTDVTEGPTPRRGKM